MADKRGLALRHGHLESANLLVQSGAEMNIESTNLLVQSGAEMNIESAKLLVQIGAEMNIESAKLLVKSGAEMDIESAKLLVQSGAEMDIESAKLLVQHGAEMDIGCAFESAVTQQLPEYMNFVVENYQPEVISYAGKEGGDLNRLLVSASKGGNVEIIGHLVDAGADVNHEVYSETPLGESKDGDVAKFLINRGADVNLKLSDGNTILLNILDNRDIIDSSTIEVVKVLLENGASVNVAGNEGRTPLMMAVYKKESVVLLQILLDHGADINIQDERGNTALIEAVKWRWPLNVSFLLEFLKEKSLSLNVQNNEGKTALMFAVPYDNLEILKLLIDFGADVNIKDMNGNTPLLHTFTECYKTGEVLTHLIEAGSDVNCQNNNGHSPLMLAACNCLEDAIIILLDSGADVNAVSQKDSTQTALSFLGAFSNSNFNCCLEHFVKIGACFSYLNPDLLHEMILNGDIGSIHLLIRSGIGPTGTQSLRLPYYRVNREKKQNLSPLYVALFVGNISLSRFFVENLFLTSSDVTSLTRNKIIRHVLEKEQFKDCLNFLEEFSSQPFSLFQLAFVTVTSAVGSSPGREDRVNMLPLPQVMKDKLLFKNISRNTIEFTTLATDYSATI